MKSDFFFSTRGFAPWWPLMEMQVLTLRNWLHSTKPEVAAWFYCKTSTKCNNTTSLSGWWRIRTYFTLRAEATDRCFVQQSIQPTVHIYTQRLLLLASTCGYSDEPNPRHERSWLKPHSGTTQPDPASQQSALGVKPPPTAPYITVISHPCED